jgi:hypothetical protein
MDGTYDSAFTERKDPKLFLPTITSALREKNIIELVYLHYK